MKKESLLPSSGLPSRHTTREVVADGYNPEHIDAFRQLPESDRQKLEDRAGRLMDSRAFQVLPESDKKELEDLRIFFRNEVVFDRLDRATRRRLEADFRREEKKNMYERAFRIFESGSDSDSRKVLESESRELILGYAYERLISINPGSAEELEIEATKLMHQQAFDEVAVLIREKLEALTSERLKAHPASSSGHSL